MMSPQQRAAELMQLRRMRVVSLIEGSTLLLLLLVAVPLKHLAGIFVATRIMGPVHGLAFLAYMTWRACLALTARPGPGTGAAGDAGAPAGRARLGQAGQPGRVVPP